MKFPKWAKFAIDQGDGVPLIYSSFGAMTAEKVSRRISGRMCQIVNGQLVAYYA